MAVSLVGTGTFITSTINGTSMALTISTGATQSGDLVVAAFAYPRGVAGTALVTSSSGAGYTQIDTVISNGNLRTSCWYRFMTSAETIANSCNSGSAQDAVVLAAIVLRGCSTDFGSNSTTGTSSNPNSPSVTVDATNSAVMTIASILANTTLSAPSGFTNTVSGGETDTRSLAMGLSYKSTDIGLTDPSSWTGGTSAAWVAWTITVASTEALPFTWLDMGHFPAMVDAPMPMIGY